MTIFLDANILVSVLNNEYLIAELAGKETIFEFLFLMEELYYFYHLLGMKVM